MRTGLRVLAVVWLLAVGCSAHVQSLDYLCDQSVDPNALLPAPAEPNEPETAAELETLLAVQAKRTPEQVERARSEVKVTMAAFQSVLGSWFTAENLPRLNLLLQKVESDAKHFSDVAKRHFGRPRPYAAEPRLQPAVDKENSPAYPSGHATRGIVFATVLAELAPDQRDALLRRGREIGWDRVIGGVHHPSDIIAGRVLGQAVARVLLASPKFQEEFSSVRAEFEAARNRQVPQVGTDRERQTPQGNRGEAPGAHAGEPARATP